MARHSLYTLRPDYWRFMLPVIFQLILVSILVYVVLIAGMDHLGYSFSFTGKAILGIGIVLVGIAFFQITDRKVKRIVYHFFQNAIEIAHLPVSSAPLEYRKLNYHRIRQIDVKRNLLDRLCKTATFRLSPSFELIGIQKPQKTYDYIQRMMVYNQQHPTDSSYYEST